MKITDQLKNNNKNKFVTRRDFVKTGSVTVATFASALFAAGKLPLLAAERGAQRGTGKQVTPPYAVRDIPGHLKKFVPVKGKSALQDRDKYTLAYDVISWRGRDVRTGMTRHAPIGELAIERVKRGETIEYSVQRTLTSCATNTLKAKIACKNNRVPALKSWALHSDQIPFDPGLKGLTAFKENGTVEKDKIRIRRGKTVTEFNAGKTVLTQWQIPEIVCGMKPESGNEVITFDLLQDCALLKQEQELRYDGAIEIKAKKRVSIKLYSFLLTGQGILPTHYLIDEKGLPQLIVAGLLSFSLKQFS